jgi:hypothetical protein
MAERRLAAELGAWTASLLAAAATAYYMVRISVAFYEANRRAIHGLLEQLLR